MSRQTAFPGILVESISVKKPPFDEPGVIQEFVGLGVTREFKDLTEGKNLTPDRIEQILEDFEEHIGPLKDEFKIKYNLIIRSAPTPDIGGEVMARRLQKRTVSGRARVYARAKNPFEADLIRVSGPTFNSRMSVDAPLNYYNVTVEVTK